MAIRVHLVRHLRVDIPGGICYGQSDIPMASDCEQEIKALRQNLSELCPAPDLVISSPLSRCSLLAECCGYLNASQDKRLMELNFGAWEMQPFDTIKDPRLALWYDDWINVAPTGGESYQMQCQRVANFLNELRETMTDGAEAIIFAHAGTLRAARVYMGDYSPKDSFNYRPHYGEVLSISLSPLPTIQNNQST